MISAFGVRVGVRASDRQALERSAALFPPGWKRVRATRVDRLYSLLMPSPAADGRIRRFNLAYADFTRIARTLDGESMLDAFEADLHRHVAEMSPRRLFVHAGVVGWRGRAIVIAGRSYSGKTTLVRALVEAGASYYSDEFAVFDARGRVSPFARPLAVRDESQNQARITVGAIGGCAGSASLPAGLVLLAPYKAGARWRVRRLSAGQGVLALLAHAVSARRQPQRALDVLRVVAEAAPVFKGLRGEAAVAAANILSLSERC